jgi:MFS family permease
VRAWGPSRTEPASRSCGPWCATSSAAPWSWPTPKVSASRCASLRRDLAPFRSRGFALLWSAGLVSFAGDWVLRIALPIHVYALTGSPLATGGVVAANVSASLLVGAIAGVYVDRWDRRRTLVAGNLVLAAIVAPLALVTTSDRIWIVYVVAFCQAVAVQFVTPAEGALLPRLVPEDQLAAANGLNALNNSLARLIGPALGGLAAALGIETVVALDLVSFLLAAVLIAAVGGVHRAEQAEERHVGAELVDGLRLIRRTGPVAVLVGMIFVTSIGEGVLGALFAPFVVDALEGGAKELGWTMTAQAIGGIAGGLLAGRILARFGPIHVVPVAIVLFGLVDLVIFNYPRWFGGIEPVLAMFVVVPGAIAIAAYLTIVQTSVADAYLGRVFAVVGVVTAAGALIGSVLGGFLAEPVGLLNLLTVQGAGYTLAGLVAGVLLRRVAPADGG